MRTPYLSGISKEAMHPVVGAGLGMTAAAGGLFALDPYIRGELISDIGGLLSKKRRQKTVDPLKQTHPPEAHAKAQAVATALRKEGFNPRKHSLAMSATAGTGKSTLASLLSQDLDLKLVFGPKNTKGIGFSRAVAKDRNIAPGHIYEQTHLFNVADPEPFDYMVKLERPTKEIFKSLKRRKKGALQRHVTNYPKLKKAINYAFDSLPGKTVSPFGGVHIKVKPEGGFNQGPALDAKLEEMGINPKGMTREDKIYKITGDRSKAHDLVARTKLNKLHPFMFHRTRRFGNMLKILGVLAAGGVAGGLAAKKL